MCGRYASSRRPEDLVEEFEIAANRVAGRCRMRIATSFDEMPDLGPGVVSRPIEDGAALPFPVGNLFKAWLRARDAGVAAIRERLGIPRNARGARPAVPVWTGHLKTHRNAVEGHLTFWTGPGVGVQEVCEGFAAAVQNALVGVEEVEVDIVVLQDRPPLAASEDDGPLRDLAKSAMRAAGLVPTVAAGTLTSDAGLLRAAGVPSLVFGPGRGAGDLYRDDESIPLAHIDAAYRFYVALIERWCTRRG